MNCSAHGREDAREWWCSREARAAGLCWAHYQQVQRGTRLRELRAAKEPTTIVRLRLPLRVFHALSDEARRLGIHITDVVKRILERWSAQ